MREWIQAGLLEVFRSVLGTHVTELRDEMTAANLRGWDSVSHIRLILAVEKKFSIRFTAREAESLRSVGEFTSHIAKRAARFEGSAPLAGSASLRKCLVLDLDDTLWGGVVGEEGPEGVTLGPGSTEGEAYFGLHRWALEQRARGVLLAVVSKNEESAARAVFERRAESLLRLEHFSAFLANWRDKAANLRAVAEMLRLSLDQLVFVDDSPAERERVRQALPQVTVPELPGDPTLRVAALSAAGFFGSGPVTKEDAKRADMYRDEERRAEAAGQAQDYDSFLASLEMKLTVAPFRDFPRIAQLFERVNQFNVTGKRCAEGEVAAMAVNTRVFTLQAHLTDRFGDSGLISAVEGEKRGDVWRVDAWLTSCRVAGRGVERALFAELVRGARAAGARCLEGAYVPTERNGPARGHYEALGFSKVSEDAAGITQWRFDLGTYQDRPSPMLVIREN